MTRVNVRLTDEALEVARRPMTPAERREQRISFVLGEGPYSTRKEVEEALRETDTAPDDPS